MRSSTVSGLHRPFSLVSVVLMLSKYFLNATLPADLNSFNCSSGLRSVFCTLSYNLCWINAGQRVFGICFHIL